MALYDVTVIALDPDSGAVESGPRTERVDTSSNQIFAECTGPWDVEDQFEAFWNRLNESWETVFPEGQPKVKVLRVKRVDPLN